MRPRRRYETPLAQLPGIEHKDHANKVGELTTLAAGQPHTTVLAFLTSAKDDVFLISMPGTFKSQVLKREPRCFFISAGFDAHEEDPLALLEVTEKGFEELARRSAQLGPRVGAVLEGGYNLATLPRLVEAALRGFDAA